MPGDVTIYDVAAEAGVSISTVSLTLNRPDRVKASTRRHVLMSSTASASPRVPTPSATRAGTCRASASSPRSPLTTPTAAGSLAC
jgi:LacI family transcriptional regulator